VEPLRLNTVSKDQLFDGVNKQENIDVHVFNGIIKEEFIDETDHHNDSQLIQKGYELNLHHSLILNVMEQFLYFKFSFKHVV